MQTSTIKFNRYHVAANGVKARVFYSNSQIFVKQEDGTRVLRDCITLYAKDYGHQLGKVFTEGYENNTDSMTDYFEKGHVRIFPESPFYAQALAAVAAQNAARAAKRGAK